MAVPLSSPSRRRPYIRNLDERDEDDNCESYDQCISDHRMARDKESTFWRRRWYLRWESIKYKTNSIGKTSLALVLRGTFEVRSIWTALRFLEFFCRTILTSSWSRADVTAGVSLFTGTVLTNRLKWLLVTFKYGAVCASFGVEWLCSVSVEVVWAFSYSSECSGSCLIGIKRMSGSPCLKSCTWMRAD